MHYSLVGLALAALIHSCTARIPRPAFDKDRVKFRKDGTFQISVFEDLKIGEDWHETWGPKQDAKTLEVMTGLLDGEEDTDLVVLNGDMFAGEFWERSWMWEGNVTEPVHKIIKPFQDRDLHWASNYGNHDNSECISSYWTSKYDDDQDKSFTNKYEEFGSDQVGVNYVVKVFKSDCRDDDCEPILIIWFFDSRGGQEWALTDAHWRLPRPNWVHKDTAKWFYRTSNNFRESYNKVIPSIGFVHTPPRVARELFKKGVDPNKNPGVAGQLPDVQADGWCRDGVHKGTCDYGGHDRPFMEALAAVPGFRALFMAHDTGNTYCQTWNSTLPGLDINGEGIKLCYGQHTGYGGYGNLTRGARQILVKQGYKDAIEVDTWIRLETGEKVGHVTLNETFGEDVYPEVPKTETFLFNEEGRDNRTSDHVSGEMGVRLRPLAMGCHYWHIKHGEKECIPLDLEKEDKGLY